MKFLIIEVLLLCGFLREAFSELDVVYAVNCGGEAHIDSNGVEYRADKNKVGTASDFGRMLTIARANPNDQILYQTERYHFKTFSYDFPVNREGDYVLVLKFSEVYFSSAGNKVFDVELNGQTVVEDLDIFERVGKGVAHDEIVPFSIRGRQVHVGDTLVPFNGKISVAFKKGSKDNPKVNAFYVARGSTSDVPKLPELVQPDVDEDSDDAAEEQPPRSNVESKSAVHDSKFRKTSGRPVTDPYASDEGWLMPLIIAFGVFIPTVFCLCRL